MTPGKPPLTQPQLIWRGCHRSSVKGQRAQSNQGPTESSQPESTERNNKEVERELPFWGVKTKKEVDDGWRKKRKPVWLKKPTRGSEEWRGKKAFHVVNANFTQMIQFDHLWWRDHTKYEKVIYFSETVCGTLQQQRVAASYVWITWRKKKKTDTGYVKYKLVLIMKTAQPQLSTLVPLTVPPSWFLSDKLTAHKPNTK